MYDCCEAFSLACGLSERSWLKGNTCKLGTTTRPGKPFRCLASYKLAQRLQSSCFLLATYPLTASVYYHCFVVSWSYQNWGTV